MTSSSRSRRTSRTCSIPSKTSPQRQSPSRATTAVTAPATGRKDRLVEVFDLAGALGGTEWASLIAALVRVRRRTLIRSAATGAWTAREETALYASSVRLPAATFATAIRNHWAIENRSHHVRDVTLAEDASRIRINPGIMARLRSQVLNIARANGIENIAQVLWIAAIDPTVSLSYKGVQ